MAPERPRRRAPAPTRQSGPSERPPQPGLAGPLQRIGVAAAVFCQALGLVVLLGWMGELTVLTRVLPGLASMKANTALCFLFSGVALALGSRLHGGAVPPWRRRTARLLSGATMALAIGTLSQYLLGWDLRIDTWLLGSDGLDEEIAHPGRMSPATAAGFALVSAALWFSNRSWSDWLAFPGLAVSVVVLAGYVDAVAMAGTLVWYTTVAFHTAVGLAVLAVGVMCARPEVGLTGLLLSSGAIGIVARRALPAAILLPVSMAWVTLQAERLGMVGRAVGVGLLTVLMVLALTFLAGTTIRALVVSEAQRRRLAEERNALFERVPVGLFRCSGSGELLDVNSALAEILGIPDREQVLREAGPRVPGGTGIDWLEPVLRQERVEALETTVRRPDGATRNVELSARRVVSPEGEVFHEGSLVDITERRQLESKLNQAQKMEALGRLAGGIAHDFNNILSVIRGAAELRELVADPVEARRFGDDILDATRRGATLTRRLLATSRRQVVEPRLVDANRVIEAMAAILRRTLREDVALSVVPGAEPATVFIDPGQLEQVLLNLAVNAREAMPNGGQLTIETSCVELDASYVDSHPVQPGPYVLVAVTDTGLGIDPAAREHLFEPFFTTKAEGTGLGLATTYGIVRQAEGYIWVYSEPGAGASFKIYLPAHRGSPGDISSRASPGREPRGTETILLAEDDEAVRRLTARILEQLGYTVLAAARATEAIALSDAHDGGIDLVVSDIVMPDGDGPGLVERILSTRPSTRALFLSGYADNSVVRRGVLGAGAAFLQKPFSRADLAEKVREALGEPAS